MPVIVHIFTVLFAILCFMIIKKKRYKETPFICFIMFVSFISFGTASLIALFAPYGEILSYPCMIIALGLLLFLVGVNDLYSIFRCTERIEGIYCGYNTYYGSHGVHSYAPVFEYTYDGVLYHEQTAQTVSHRRLTKNMTEGNRYSIYINPKCPSVYILFRRLRASGVVCFIIGAAFMGAGAVILYALFPVLFK